MNWILKYVRSEFHRVELWSQNGQGNISFVAIKFVSGDKSQESNNDDCA